jgi:enoyl-CoA hydratase/carnithine racemase
VEATIELGALWKWYDADPELRCAVFTGAGEKAFCAGMDLKQRLALIETGDVAYGYPREPNLKGGARRKTQLHSQLEVLVE